MGYEVGDRISMGHEVGDRISMGHEVGDRISRDRIVSLTDAVLAIVMTLLVLEIVVPDLSRSEAATELPKRLLELLPVVWSYAISFIISLNCMCSQFWTS
jgi:uncharacterized membrane protein